MSEAMIPIVMFVGLTVVISMFFWFKYRARNDIQATIRAVIERGQELSPEVIDRLGHPKPPKNRDLRLALIWLATALAFALFALGMGTFEEEAFRALVSIAAFPFCIGLAYLVMWRFAGNEK